jgi:hypothetical protein
LENAALLQGVNLTDSSFTNIKTTFSYSATYIWTSSANINISDSVFRNISSSISSTSAGDVYYNMSSSGNGYYYISGNIFYNISTNKSVLVLKDRFNLFYSFIILFIMLA